MIIITYGLDAYPMIDGTSISVPEPRSRWKIPQGRQIRVPFKCTFILIYYWSIKHRKNLQHLGVKATQYLLFYQHTVHILERKKKVFTAVLDERELYFIHLF